MRGDFVKPVVVNFTQNQPDVLNLPLKELPLLTPQKRPKTGRTSSLNQNKMMGADTETIDGNIWLFSTEAGVWEINSFVDLITVLYNKYHAKKWRTGRKNAKNSKGKRGKNARGITPKQFFFWNLKYDAQSIFHFFEPNQIDTLLVGDKVKIKVTPTGYNEEIEVQLKYLEGKYLEIKPTWKIGEYKVGTCYWCDI